MPDTPANVDEYIASFPEDVRTILQNIRRTIHDAVPDAGEKISYQIPALTRDGKAVVYFSGWQKHISVYPAPDTTDVALDAELSPYKSGKGTLKFPLAEPLPYDLIGRVAALLLAQHFPEAPDPSS
ncbi:DUF1801 domain-containing protein [Streptomyces sp. N2-109]|uniref:DUF1801 domain-containing protein n=1 Tax=Streptomyces gossypii TaxID=2883101 RepID=A0ABT2JSW7_9ACTN|nr:DUF1801 domain-containing protein [Streptomyces gossypii]MCT2590970.1 DUF1801 domain-containing protein [Streptomyces gossypii]